MKHRWIPALAACAALSACAGGGALRSAPLGYDAASALSAGDVPVLGGCRVFPRSDPWNVDISNYPVDPHSADYLANMHPAAHLHPDFGSNPGYGIPWIAVPGTQAFLPVTFDDPQESDPGPYPFPPTVPIERGSDRHALVIDSGSCMLYETYATKYLGPPPTKGFHASSGAVFSFNEDNPQRTDGWTSADAAGLAILPGLVKKSEADSGTIRHAFRFTMGRTQSAFVHPAQHCTSGYPVRRYPYYPPMGLRVRLKAAYDISHFAGDGLAIAAAMKRFGMLLADNGSDWYFTGETNPQWNDNDLDQLKSIPANAFEVVQTGPTITGFC